MANVYRYRRGEPKPIVMTPQSTTVIEQGDLLFLDNTTNSRGTGSSTANYSPYPFSSIDGGTSQAADEALASDQFLGVAMAASAPGDTDPILIYRAGEFVFPLDSATTVYVGDVMEVYSTAQAAVADQIVTKGTTDPLGRCVKEEASAFNVNMEIFTAFVQGGLIS